MVYLVLVATVVRRTKPMWSQLYGMCYCSFNDDVIVSDITDVSTIGHSLKTDSSPTPLFHVAHYGHGIIGREINLRKLLSFVMGTKPIIVALEKVHMKSVKFTTR